MRPNHNGKISWERDLLFNELGRKCELCGSKKNLTFHHKDYNKANNLLENLSILCNNCHIKKHRERIISFDGEKELMKLLNKSKSIRVGKKRNRFSVFETKLGLTNKTLTFYVPMGRAINMDLKKGDTVKIFMQKITRKGGK